MQTILALLFVLVTETNVPLVPCPSSPNCVSSQATDRHFIEPLPITGEAAQTAFARLKEILERRSDTTLVAADARALRLEFKTALGFVDDGLFVLDRENGTIQLRSASRSGYWDFGKNRRRLEEIRREFLSPAVPKLR